MIELPTISYSSPELPGLLCEVSTRRGGVSEPPYDELNLGFSTGDRADRVRENRRRLFERIGIDERSVAAGRQVHGTRVARVGLQEWGRGGLDPALALSGTDALLTTERGVYLLGLSADCPLFLLAAPPARGVLVAHAGWRGVAGGMPGASVKALASATGAAPGEMLAWIGPAIGPCCYEVGEEVVRSLAPRAREAAHTETQEDGSPRITLDLALAIRILLREAGLPDDRIASAGVCSSCDPARFFSHRRDKGFTGRIAMVAGLRE